MSFSASPRLEIRIDPSIVFPLGAERSMDTYTLGGNAGIGEAFIRALPDGPMAADLREQFGRQTQDRAPHVAGDVEVYGPLASGHGGVVALDVEKWTRFFQELLPDDATDLTVRVGPELRKLEIQRTGGGAGPSSHGRYVHAVRTIGGSPVIGKGSVAAIHVQNDEIDAAVIRWNQASKSGEVTVPSVSEEAFRAGITELFRDLGDASGGATIRRVEVVYLDDRRTLQPVFAIDVYLDRPFGAPDIFQFIVPTSYFETGGPVQSFSLAEIDLCMQSAPSTSQKVNVDRYVIAGDQFTGPFNKNAKDFGSQLSASADFAFRNYCFSESRFFARDKAMFADSAHVVLVEAHGQPAVIQTNGSPSALETFKFERDAFGAGGLLLLILHACKVIESPDDNPADWAKPWWPTFGGLHTMVGFRTDAHVDDGVSEAYGKALSADGRVISSWLMETRARYPPGSTYPGRAAAITECGKDNALASELTTLAAPDCLVIWWHSD